MTQIRRPLIGLLTLFTTALTLDRFGLASDGGNAVSTSAYLVALGVIALPFGLVGLRRTTVSRTVTIALVVHVVITVLIGEGIRPFALYVHVTETAFVMLAAGLAHRIAAGLDQIDETLGTVVFGEPGSLALDSPQAASEILTEMARSRRHDRPLIVTVVAPRPASIELAVERAAEDVQRALRERYVATKLSRAMAQRLRRSDLVFRDEATGRFVVLSPETGPEGAEYVVERIREASRAAAVEVDAGSATFPDTAFSFEALVAAAEENLSVPTTVAPKLRAVEGLS
ncbi:MAG TPA: hypothetical protein VLD62_09055 [Acidimicrobiia bacterium]|nr:hypothetical protein [Acidimicrobiia bacterium]